ncbi:hypothetical protein Hanom_Chr16g01448371 [Helianthus anomalus]
MCLVCPMERCTHLSPTKQINKKKVNYKFCPLCLHQIVGTVLLAKSLQALSLTFQNLTRFVL